MGKFSLDAKDHTTSTGLLTACSVVFAAGEAGEIVEMIMTGSGVTAPADVQHSARGCTFDECRGRHEYRANPESVR